MMDNDFEKGEWVDGQWHPAEGDNNIAAPPPPQRTEIPDADLELLSLAASALGAVRFEVVDGEGYGNLHFADGAIVYSWNPLAFSHDAFDLAVALDLDVLQAVTCGEVRAVAPMCPVVVEPWGDGKTAATRRAVTRVAAQIGKQHS